MLTTEECVAINSHESTTESKYALSRKDSTIALSY